MSVDDISGRPYASQFGAPDIILVIGRRGTGKTYFARSLARAWPRDMVFVHDPMYQLLLNDFDNECGPESLIPGALLLLDEIDILAPPTGYKEPWVRDAIHYGRHKGITVIGCARRPANVHRDVSALAGKVYLGKITEPRDLKYCVEAWGIVCSQAPNIPTYSFLEIFP